MFVQSADNKANLFTKNLGIEDFERHTKGMFLSHLKQEGCWNIVFQDVRKRMWGNKNARHKYSVTGYYKTWTLEVTWKHSQNKETYTKMRKKWQSR